MTQKEQLAAVRICDRTVLYRSVTSIHIPDRRQDRPMRTSAFTYDSQGKLYDFVTYGQKKISAKFNLKSSNWKFRKENWLFTKQGVMLYVIVIIKRSAGLSLTIMLSEQDLRQLWLKNYLGTGQIAESERVDNYRTYGENGFDLGEKFRSHT